MAIDLTQYKNIDLVNFVKHYGYSDKTSWAKSKRSVNYPAFENVQLADKIIIKKSINAYTEAHEQQKYKDIIQFVSDRINTLFKTSNNTDNTFLAALDILNSYIGNNVGTPKIITEPLIENARSLFNLNHFIIAAKLPVTNYLTTIGLDRSIYNHPLFANKILLVRNPMYEDKNFKQPVKHTYGNISFPYIKDLNSQKIIGFEQRNTNFKGHAIFSDKVNGIWISNYNADTRYMLICESAKDALAHFALYKRTDLLYCSVGGHLSLGQINTINKIAGELKLVKVLGFDNDINGDMFTIQTLMSSLSEINRVTYNSKKNTLSFHLVDKDDLFLKFSTFFSNPVNAQALIEKLVLSDGHFKFSVKSDLNISNKIIYFTLKENRNFFKGNILLQRPDDKDYFETFEKKKTAKPNKQFLKI